MSVRRGALRYFSYENYFGPIFARLEQRGSRVKVVSACDPGKPGVVKELVEKLGAVVVSPRVVGRETKQASVAADFLYLTRATTLVVTESTYSWWAAFLGTATAVHAPGAGVVPVPVLEPRYTFHDPKGRKYWGTYDAAARGIVYAVDGNATATAPAAALRDAEARLDHLRAQVRAQEAAVAAARAAAAAV